MNTTHHKYIVVLLILLAMTACSRQQDAAEPMSQSNGAMQKTEPQPVTEPQAPVTELKNVVQDDSGKTVLYWHDPMVADKHFEKPGKSPFMDMQLVPKYAESEKP